jgi:hypothetical protein
LTKVVPVILCSPLQYKASDIFEEWTTNINLSFEQLLYINNIFQKLSFHFCLGHEGGLAPLARLLPPYAYICYGGRASHITIKIEKKK